MPMHCVIWTYRLLPDMTKERADQLFIAVAERYFRVPGLMRKYFGFAEDGRSVVGVYLWRSRAEADAFFSPDWLAGVTTRWGAAPERADWTIPQYVDAETMDVVRAPLPVGLRSVGPEDEDRRVKPGEFGANDD
ncbi:MAG: hypothetical protein AB7O56_00840 [Bauldia sp.]